MKAVRTQVPSTAHKIS